MAVVMWGEFGRAPRIARIAGRDHWPEAGAAVVAGGGFQSDGPAARDRQLRPDGAGLGSAGADVARIHLPIQVLTGLELDADGLFRPLDAAAWNARRAALLR